MEIVQLINQNEKNEQLIAKFCPEKGLNLISLTKNGREILDQNTKHLFDERSAGLGALIGPHFHHRQDENITTDFDENLFPHIAAIKKKGQKEYFSHGIARYVPWKYQASETQIDAYLTSLDCYKGTKIKDFEGFDFDMHFHAALLPDGLLIDFTIHSSLPSVIGFHYYYAIDKDAFVEAFVQEKYRIDHQWKNLPEKWYDPTKKKLHFDLSQEADFGFKPLLHEPHHYHKIMIKSKTHITHIEFTSSNEEETSWQLYHPQNESFVCVEPLTSLNPRYPQLKSSNLQLKINSFNI